MAPIDTETQALTVVGIFTRQKTPGEELLPEDYGLKDVTRDQIMCRKKLIGPGTFVPEQGLVGATFFHSDLEEHDDEDSDDEDGEERIYEERAILLQSVENYQDLIENPSTSNYFQTDDAQGEAVHEARKQKLIEHVQNNPCFGEQVIVSGLKACEIAVGDVFEVGSLKIEITSPRLCCAWVDKKVGSPFGMKGVKRYCNLNGLGGFFARVLEAGELQEGSKLVRTAKPHAKWTLPYISESLYGEGPKSYKASGWAYWVKSKQELAELCAVEPLGRYEWKDEAQYILENLDKYPKVKSDPQYAIKQFFDVAQRALMVHRRHDTASGKSSGVHMVPMLSSSKRGPLSFLSSNFAVNTVMEGLLVTAVACMISIAIPSLY